MIAETDRNIKLVMIKWIRPSDYHPSGYFSGTFHQKCEPFEVPLIIDKMKQKCLNEGYGREILNIETFTKDV